MPLAQVGEIELDYERSGAGPPLLLIMGMSGTYLHWGEPFLAPLREHFELIVYDHRGVGSSSRMDARLTIAQMAADAEGLLGALGLDSAHVLGISMGGMIAQELALGHPERIRTLTLGCTYCGGAGSALAAPETMQALVEAQMSGERERVLRVMWEINVSPTMAADDHAYARFLQIAAQRAVAQPVIMAQMRAIAEHDTSARLGQLEPPTLVIHGTADRLLPVQNGRLIASLVSGSQLEIFDDVGHMFWWERPALSAALIRAHAACLTTPSP
jgi:3-oxoadipate enol-lactonase